MCAIMYQKKCDVVVTWDKPYQNLIDEVDKAIAGANRDHHKEEKKQDNDIAKFIYEEEVERKCGKCDS